jgi:hypothetical protein
MATDFKFLVDCLWYGFLAFGVFALIHGEINKRGAFERNNNGRCARCNAPISPTTTELITVAGRLTFAKACHQCFKRDGRIWWSTFSFLIILIVVTIGFVVWAARN